MARAGNAIAVQGQIEAAMLRGGRAAATQTRQLGAMEQQMRALGTTIRYAFAGGVVFGITGLIGKLNQLQQQLGLISAIGPTAGVNFDASGLQTYLTEVEQKAVSARTPVNELNDSVINFLSTVQGAPKNEIVDIVSQIGIASKLSQTPTEDLTKAVSTLNIAAGRTNNLKNTNALLREWFHLISSAPGGIAAAPQIAQQLGPLSAIAMRQGRMTPEQMFSVVLGGLRFGATPSTALRGAQYGLQSLFSPKGKYATSLAGAGLTPRKLEAEGGAAFVLDYLRKLDSLGAGKKLTKKQVTQFGAYADSNPDTEAELAPNENVPGLTSQQSRFLNNTVGRIHGIRFFITLLAQLQRTPQVSSISDLYKTFDQLHKNVGKDANELKKAADRYRAATPLQAAAVALNTLSTQVQTSLAPVFNLLGSAPTAIQKQAAAHPHETQLAVRAGAGALAAAGLIRLLRGGLSFGGLGRGGASALIAGQALSSVGNTQLGGSISNPIYAVIVGQLFGGGTLKTPGTTTGPGGVATTAEKEAEKSRGLFSRLLAPVIAVTGAAVISHETNKTLKQDHAKHPGGIRGFLTGTAFAGLNLGQTVTGMLGQPPWARGHDNFWKMSNAENIFTGKRSLSSYGPDQRRQLSPLLAKLAKNQVDDEVANIAGVFQAINKAFAQPQHTTVDGGVDVGIKITDPAGKTKDARVHIPLSTVHQGGRVPSSRGKRKSMRVDFTVGGTDLRVGGKP